MIKLGVKEALLGAALALLPEAAEAKKPRSSESEKQITALCAKERERVYDEVFWANDFETKGTRARVARVADAEETACKLRLRKQRELEKHGPAFRGRGMEIEL